MYLCTTLHNDMTNIEIYQGLSKIEGGIQDAANKAGVHRNTLTRVLLHNKPSNKEQEIRLSGMTVIAEANVAKIHTIEELKTSLGGFVAQIQEAVA